ncbi:hypothetical protein B7494_g5096 [Chlorociboria aeruginascens]|nr:hypothetical protein B7494_g5096 [Chlorociboria aeruginascens]
MLIREATPTDIDQVTSVLQTALPGDPSWRYRYPYRDQYPSDHHKYNREMIARFISPDYKDWLVLVVESADEAPPQKAKIVSFSVWDLTYVNKRIHGRSYEPRLPSKDTAEAGGSTRKDANHAHIAASIGAITRARKEYFEVFQSHRMHLQWLATLPDYCRRGFGSALVRWGMDRAARDGVALTLVASPQGFELYRKLGFRYLGDQMAKVQGEEECVVMRFMVFESEAKGFCYKF